MCDQLVDLIKQIQARHDGELTEARMGQARAEERVNLLRDAIIAETARQVPQEPACQYERHPDGFAKVESDPLRALNEMQADFRQRHQQQQLAQAEARIRSEYQAHANAFMAENPDYQDYPARASLPLCSRSRAEGAMDELY